MRVWGFWHQRCCSTEKVPGLFFSLKKINLAPFLNDIGEDTVANFEERTGIKVNHDVYDSNEMLETKLLTGNSGYDVVMPTAYFLERQIKAGVFQKLDKTQLTNYGNLDVDTLARMAPHDTNNEYGVPYMWGTTGIGYNEARVRVKKRCQVYFSLGKINLTPF